MQLDDLVETIPGPSKLFLLVKAPASLSLPSHFLPKRDFRYHKKVMIYCNDLID